MVMAVLVPFLFGCVLSSDSIQKGFETHKIFGSMRCWNSEIHELVVEVI